MTRATTLRGLCALLLAAPGCGSTVIIGSNANDAGNTDDRGQVLVDTGTPLVDAGQPIDTGFPRPDSGPPPIDVSLPIDLGTPVDLGQPSDTNGCVGGAPEVCDGIDNDCDGQIDNVPPTACSPTACSIGVTTCRPGIPRGTVEPALCLRAGAAPMGRACRAAAGPCDAAEVCDGVSDQCPADRFLTPSMVCRAATGVCDPAEVCNGQSAECPVNGFLPPSTSCGMGLNCDGMGRCGGCPGNPSTEVCDGIDNDCDGRIDDGVRRDCYTGPSLRRLPSPQPFIDACAVPGRAVLLASMDDGVSDLIFPFPFRAFGQDHVQGYVASNGFVGFGARSTSSFSVNNTALPANAFQNVVFPFWDDLYQRTGICVATVGMAPRRQFVVQWQDAYFFGSGGMNAHLTFEVVLSEGTNTIDVIYQRMEGDPRTTGDSATVGIQQGPGMAFDQVGFNTPSSVQPGTGIRWLTNTTQGVGQCRAGTQTCINGTWSTSCSGQVVPASETCNRLDDDCNGLVDDAANTCP